MLAILLALIVTLGTVEGVSAILLHYLRHGLELPDSIRRQVVSSEFPKTTADPYRLFRILPHQDGGHYSTDSRGLRGAEFEPREKQLRVLLLGGSVAWSYLVRSNDETLSAELARYLNRELEFAGHPSWESAVVLNAGVPAYVNRQEAIYYARDLRGLATHMVVTLDGVNDINAALTMGVGMPLFWNGGQDQFRRRPQALAKVLSRWIQYRWRRSKFARLRGWINPRPVGTLAATPQQVASSYLDSLYYLSTLTSLDKAVLVPVLQPVCIFSQKKTLTPFENELARIHEEEMPGRNDFFAQSYLEMGRGFAQISRAFDQVSTLDATAAFERESEHCFADCYHLTPLGIRLLAETIGSHLIRNLPLSEPAP